jgi:methylase of polypeptide subunit release factors
MAERALSRKKSLGSDYTLPTAVRFLVDWGLAPSPGRVMDPSSGDGRFLLEAACRGATGLVGCDVHADALAKAEAALGAVPVDCRLHHQDFFLLDSESLGQVDLVVGNPPFIRYQQFSGETRARALASALRIGDRLSRLSASWAPFLLHALQFLRPRGAMAMVVPAELAQTAYGTETLRALCANFARIRLLTFRHNWFEDAQPETCGGILKLEPTEMQRLRLIIPVVGKQDIRSAFEQADRLIRDGDFHAANAVADDLILRRGIGSPDANVQRLRQARETLLKRRTTRSRPSR